MPLPRRYSSWPAAIGVGSSFGALGVLVAGLVTDKVARLYPEYYLLFALAAGVCVLVSMTPMWARRIPWLGIAVGVGAVFVAGAMVQGPKWVH